MSKEAATEDPRLQQGHEPVCQGSDHIHSPAKAAS